MTTEKRLNRKNMPADWRIQTGLNPNYFISLKKWMKECGKQVAIARKTGNVDAAIKALAEGKQHKAAIKSTLAKDHTYFVYDPDGKCRYILECETKKKWQAYNAG